MNIAYLGTILSLLKELWDVIVSGFKDGHPYIIGLVSFIVGTIVTFIIRFIAPAAKRLSFSDSEVKEASRYFIPNHVKIFDQNDSDITPDYFKNCTNPVWELRHFLLKSDDKAGKYFFLIAPTGVGKTTFLLNFHRHYYWKSWFSIRPALITGRIHDGDVSDYIKKIKAKGDKRDESWLNKIKFPFSNPKRKILLLDALDEFSPTIYGDTAAFWKGLDEHWQKVKEELAPFRKVIITVREQFLQYGFKSSDDKQEITGLTSHTINGREMQYIKLQPFTFPDINTSAGIYNPEKYQVDAYIKKRYKKSKKLEQVKQNRNNLLRLQLRGEGISLISIPLVLQYLEDLDKKSILEAARHLNPGVSYSKVLTEKTVNRYDVYTTIIKKWLERETAEEGKKVPVVQIEQAFEFCGQLAFEMAKAGQGSAASRLSTNQFNAFEKAYIKERTFFKNYSDRSLLQKFRVADSDTIGFVHSTFLEYFLASYAFQLEKEASVVNSPITPTTATENAGMVEWNRMDDLLSNPSLNFAREMLIDWSWHQLKSSNRVPTPYPLTAYKSKIIKTNYRNVSDLPTIQKWLGFIESISPYRFLKEALRNSMTATLENADKDWHETFKPLEKLWIVTENFFEGDVPNATTQQFIRYYKTFITGIILERKPIAGSDLACFDGVQNVMLLYLFGLSLSGNCLSYFSASKHTLEELVLQKNHFTDNDLIPFEGVSKLIHLNLAENSLSGACTHYFKASYPPKLHGFHFFSNPTNSNDLESFFSGFPATTQWRGFGISNMKLQNIIRQFLIHSSKCLEALSIRECSVTDEELVHLSQFNALEWLDLGINQLTGKNFHFFLPFRDTLETISFRKNELGFESLGFFLQNHFQKLQEIYIVGCPPQNPIILQELREKGVTITEEFI